MRELTQSQMAISEEYIKQREEYHRILERTYSQHSRQKENEEEDRRLTKSVVLFPEHPKSLDDYIEPDNHLSQEIP